MPRWKNDLDDNPFWVSSHLIPPVKQLPDMAKHAVLNDDEGGRHLVSYNDDSTESLSFVHLKGVNVGV